MSDYLNSLVSRTLRLGPVVQPRLPSLFEPVAAGSASEPATEVSETSAPQETAPPPATLTYTPVQVNIEAQPLNESAAAVVEFRSMPVPLVPGPTMPPPVLSLSNPEDTRKAVRDESTESTPASENRSDPAPPRLKPAVHIRSSSKDREQIQPSLTTPPPPAILTYPAPPAPLSPGRRVNTQAAVEAEAPEPVVITIGRVDVRAVFPSQPQPAPRSNRASSQAMSLDDYLKQRSEGRR